MGSDTQRIKSLKAAEMIPADGCSPLRRPLRSLNGAGPPAARPPSSADRMRRGSQGRGDGGGAIIEPFAEVPGHDEDTGIKKETTAPWCLTCARRSLTCCLTWPPPIRYISHIV